MVRLGRFSLDSGFSLEPSCELFCIHVCFRGMLKVCCPRSAHGASTGRTRWLLKRLHRSSVDRMFCRDITSSSIFAGVDMLIYRSTVL